MTKAVAKKKSETAGDYSGLVGGISELLDAARLFARLLDFRHE